MTIMGNSIVDEIFQQNYKFSMFGKYNQKKQIGFFFGKNMD